MENKPTSPVQFKLEKFEGPLDLLLHLIRINELDVFDIPIVKITEQFLSHLDLMKQINIDISSEFMLMAATLIHIKSKMLLPVEEGDEDPRVELVERLLEHQQYKEAAINLARREEEELLTWRSPKSLVNHYVEVDEELMEADIFQLISAFQRVMQTIGRARQIEIEHQIFSVEEKVRWLEGVIKEKPRLLFSDIIRQTVSKRELITIFLALLELVRRRTLIITQGKNYGEIILIKRKQNQQVIALE